MLKCTESSFFSYENSPTFLHKIPYSKKYISKNSMGRAVIAYFPGPVYSIPSAPDSGVK